MEKIKGKAYANRKKETERPDGDFYPTPKACVWELLNANDCGCPIFMPPINGTILDPCCGKYAITNVLKENGFDYCDITERDLMYGNDFLEDDYSKENYDNIIMNPPFKLFNEFVIKSKEIATRVYCIGKIDFLNAHNRNINGLWEHLEWILPFDRKIAYDKPWREDGKFEVGMLNSCWYVWNKNYKGYPKVKILDVQKYVLHKSEVK